MSTTAYFNVISDIKTLENVSVMPMEWTLSPIHAGQTRIVLKLIFPDQYSEDVVFLIPGFTSQFVHTYGVQITDYTPGGFNVTIAPPAERIPLIKPGERTKYFEPPHFTIPTPLPVIEPTPTETTTTEPAPTSKNTIYIIGAIIASIILFILIRRR